jgi:hypothetical protein
VLGERGDRRAGHLGAQPARTRTRTHECGEGGWRGWLVKPRGRGRTHECGQGGWEGRGG